MRARRQELIHRVAEFIALRKDAWSAAAARSIRRAGLRSWKAHAPSDDRTALHLNADGTSAGHDDARCPYQPPPPPPPEDPPLLELPPPPPPPDRRELSGETVLAKSPAAAAHVPVAPAPPERPPLKPDQPELDVEEEALPDQPPEVAAPERREEPDDCDTARADHSSTCFASPKASTHGIHSLRSAGAGFANSLTKNSRPAANVLRVAIASRERRERMAAIDDNNTARASVAWARAARWDTSTIPGPAKNQRKITAAAIAMSPGVSDAHARARPQ